MAETAVEMEDILCLWNLIDNSNIIWMFKVSIHILGTQHTTNNMNYTQMSTGHEITTIMINMMFNEVDHYLKNVKMHIIFHRPQSKRCQTQTKKKQIIKSPPWCKSTTPINKKMLILEETLSTNIWVAHLWSTHLTSPRGLKHKAILAKEILIIILSIMLTRNTHKPMSIFKSAKWAAQAGPLRHL